MWNKKKSRRGWNLKKLKKIEANQVRIGSLFKSQLSDRNALPLYIALKRRVLFTGQKDVRMSSTGRFQSVLPLGYWKPKVLVLDPHGSSPQTELESYRRSSGSQMETFVVIRNVVLPWSRLDNLKNIFTFKKNQTHKYDFITLTFPYRQEAFVMFGRLYKMKQSDVRKSSEQLINTKILFLFSVWTQVSSHTTFESGKG